MENKRNYISTIKIDIPTVAQVQNNEELEQYIEPEEITSEIKVNIPKLKQAMDNEVLKRFLSFRDNEENPYYFDKLGFQEMVNDYVSNLDVNYSEVSAGAGLSVDNEGNILKTLEIDLSAPTEEQFQELKETVLYYLDDLGLEYQSQEERKNIFNKERFAEQTLDVIAQNCDEKALENEIENFEISSVTEKDGHFEIKVETEKENDLEDILSDIEDDLNSFDLSYETVYDPLTLNLQKNIEETDIEYSKKFGTQNKEQTQSEKYIVDFKIDTREADLDIGRDKNDEPMAFFTNITYKNGTKIQAYEHFGEHFESDMDYYKADFMRSATYEEYKDLLAELKRIGYDNIEVVNEKNQTVEQSRLDNALNNVKKQMQETVKTKIAQTFAIEKLQAAGIEVISDKDEFNKILASEKLLQKMSVDLSKIKDVKENSQKTQTQRTELQQKILSEKQYQSKLRHDIVDTIPKLEDIKTSNNNLIYRFTDNEKKEIFVKALEETAVPLNEVLYSRENYNQLFMNGIIESPVETVKLGKNQFIKLCPPNRNNLMGAIYETITKPSIILAKETLDLKSGNEKPVHVYGKSFINQNNNNTRAVESIIIFRDGKNIAISLHNKNLWDFVKQIKTTNDIIYIDNEVSRVASLNQKIGVSHVRSEALKLLPSEGFNSNPSNNNYHTSKILSIKKMIEDGKLQEGKILITKENYDHYFNIFNQHNDYKNNSNKIANTLFYNYVPEDKKDEMKKWLESQDYKITNKYFQNMTLQNGTTYGFTHEGKIYLNPDVINSATPIHEYTHLWDNYIQNANTELWNKGKEAFKNTTLWNEVINDPHYADITDNDDLVLSECHARITGKVAEKILERIALENGEIKKDEIIDWDKETWKYIAENFSYQDIEKLESVKDFIKTPMKDLMEGKNINLEHSNEETINELEETLITGLVEHARHHYNGDNNIGSESFSYDGNEWRIANGGYDLAYEIYKNNIPVVDIDTDGSIYPLNSDISFDEFKKVLASVEKGFDEQFIPKLEQDSSFHLNHDTLDIEIRDNEINKYLPTSSLLKDKYFGIDNLSDTVKESFDKSWKKLIEEKLNDSYYSPEDAVAHLTTMEDDNVILLFEDFVEEMKGELYFNLNDDGIQEKLDISNYGLSKEEQKQLLKTVNDVHTEHGYEVFLLDNKFYIRDVSVNFNGEFDANPLEFKQTSLDDLIKYVVTHDSSIPKENLELCQKAYNKFNMIDTLENENHNLKQEVSNLKQENKVLKEKSNSLSKEVSNLKKSMNYLCSMSSEKLESIAKDMKHNSDKDLGARMSRKIKETIRAKEKMNTKQKPRSRGMEY